MFDIKFVCSCGQPIKCDVSAAGTTVPCPGCGKSVTVPRATSALEGQDVFLSYRRNGGENLVRLVLKSLKQRGYTVFMDVESLKQGKFDEAILGHIELATDVVVVCSRGALDRCVNDDDWVRKEIYHALLHNKNVICLTDRGFQMPELPPDIARLKDCPEFPMTDGYSDPVIGEMADKFFQSEPDPELRQIDEASEEGRALQWAQVRAWVASGVAGIVFLFNLISVWAAWLTAHSKYHHMGNLSLGMISVAMAGALVILVGAWLSRNLIRVGPWLILAASMVPVLVNGFLSYRFLTAAHHLATFYHASMVHDYVQCSVNVVPFLVLALLYRKGK